MEQIWKEMFQAAKAVQNGRQISDYVEAGGVAAAILSSSGKIYVGVCVDTCSALGICAERNAIFNMKYDNKWRTGNKKSACNHAKRKIRRSIWCVSGIDGSAYAESLSGN